MLQCANAKRSGRPTPFWTWQQPAVPECLMNKRLKRHSPRRPGHGRHDLQRRHAVRVHPAVPGSVGRLGIGHTFLTNNSSKSAKDYLAHLRKIGIAGDGGPALHLHAGDHRASAAANAGGAAPVRARHGQHEPGACEAAGFALTADSASDEPDAVLVGFDTELTFARLCRAAYWISKGKPFIATHPDRVCPTDQPTVLVDCGAICAALKRRPGAPRTWCWASPIRACCAASCTATRWRRRSSRMVGDRLYTDMAMAHRAGALGGAGADRRDHRGGGG